MSQITRRINDEPAENTRVLWEISHDGQCPFFHYTPRRTATALVDVLTRRLTKGWPQRTLNVKLLDPDDRTLWDATADVAAVLAATGWPGPGADREETICLLEAILIEDH